MILLGWHAHFSCKEEVFFKVCVKSCMFGMKWFLTTSAKMGNMKKQFEGLGENLHKKMHQVRGLWHNQWSITPSFFRWIRRRLWAVNVNVSGKIHCCLLMGKSRETPKKYVTIPRLKLVAVVLSMKKAALIRRELDN